MEDNRNLTSIVHGLWSLMQPAKSQAKKALAWIAVNELLSLVEPYIMMVLIDHLTQQGAAVGFNRWAFAGMVALAFLAYVVLNLANRFKKQWVYKVVNQLEYDVMVDCSEHLLNRPTVTYQTDNPGKVVGRLKEGVSQSLEVIWELAFGLLPVIAKFAIVLVVLFAVRYQAGLAAFAIVLAFAWTEYKSKQKTRGIRKELADLKEDVDASVAQALDNIETVQAFGQEQREHNRITNLMGLKRDLENKDFALTMDWDFLHQILFNFGSLAVFGICAYAWLTKSLTVGELFFVIHLANRAFDGAKGLSLTYRKLIQSEEPIRRTLQILAAPLPEEEAEDEETIEQADGSLELQHVSFAYPAIGPAGEPTGRSGPDVLRDISLTIDPKSYVAVVGLSGCGKTTLLNLISGALRPDDGLIRVLGRDLRTLGRRVWRNQVGMLGLPQLFSTTVANNIAYGRRLATQDAIVAAAQQAQAHDFIEEMPNGYRQQIGNKGARLSAGQKQRLCLARALLGDPAILLLDEPLNHLDVQSSGEVLDSIRKLRGSRTIIHVTHQLWSIADADRIVVMDQGKIIEQGTHQQLMSNHGLYWILFEKQRIQHKEMDILGQIRFVC